MAFPLRLKCPRCGGRLFLEDKELKCFACGRSVLKPKNPTYEDEAATNGKRIYRRKWA